MSAITVTAEEVALVHPTKAETFNVILAEDASAGDVLYQTTAGTFGLSANDVNAKDEPRGIALEQGASSQVISMVKQGAIYGVDLSGEAYDGLVYVTSSASGHGGMSDSVVSEIVGRVIPLTDSDKTKVLYVDFPWGEADIN